MSINKIVNSLWISDEIGLMQKMCMSSYLANGHEFHLYTYKNIKGLPQGVTVKNANEILKREHVFLDNRNSYATFSDWFRIALLYKKGGWWVDADTVCLKYFDFPADYVFATEYDGSNTCPLCCNAVIKMPKGSKLGSLLLTDIKQRIKRKGIPNIYWTEIGARLFPDRIIQLNLLDFFLIPEVFCPVSYTNYQDIVNDTQLILAEETYAIHLWNKMWEWANKLPENEIAKGSVFDKLTKQYLVNKELTA
jgi:hypothetical protein